MKTEGKKCFVISPIGEENSEVRKKSDLFLNVIKELSESFSIEFYRGEEISNPPFDINKDIMEALRKWELCVVDLTDLNPNVLFEFGIRYQTDLPFVLCAEKGTKLPFDTHFIRTIFYENLEYHTNVMEFKNKIKKYIQTIEDNGYKNTKENRLKEENKELSSEKKVKKEYDLKNATVTLTFKESFWFIDKEQPDSFTITIPFETIFKHVSVRLSGRVKEKDFLKAVSSYREGYDVDYQQGLILKNQMIYLGLLEETGDEGLIHLTEFGKKLMFELNSPMKNDKKQ